MLYWFDRLMLRLGKNTPEVTGLLAHNPFSDRPPRYLRVLVYRYRFTSSQERRESGNWWRLDYLGQFPKHPAQTPLNDVKQEQPGRALRSSISNSSIFDSSNSTRFCLSIR